MTETETPKNVLEPDLECRLNSEGPLPVYIRANSLANLESETAKIDPVDFEFRKQYKEFRMLHATHLVYAELKNGGYLCKRHSYHPAVRAVLPPQVITHLAENYEYYNIDSIQYDQHSNLVR